MMDQQEIETVLQQQGLPNLLTLCTQIFNNGLFNLPLIKNLTSRGIIVRITFGQEHPDHYHIEVDPSVLVADVSDVPFQVQWPYEIARILETRGLTSTEALKFSSKVELRLLPDMTPRMIEYIMKELHKRQIFLQEYPTPERQQIVLDTAIEQLGLPKRTQQILLDERIYTIGLLTTWTFDALAQLAGLGKSSVTEIQRKLTNIGLSLSRNPFHSFSNSRSITRL